MRDGLSVPMNPPPSQLDVLSDAWPRRLTCSPMICQAQPHAQPRCGHPRRQRWQQLALAASPQSGAASSASQLGSVGQANTRSTSAATPPTRRMAAEHPQNTGCPPWWRGTGRRAQPLAATALPAGPAPVWPVPSWKIGCGPSRSISPKSWCPIRFMSRIGIGSRQNVKPKVKS